MSSRRSSSRTLQIILLLVIGVTAGILVDQQWLCDQQLPPSIPDEHVSQFALIGEAWRTIEQEYVDQEATEPQQLTYGAISGLVRSLGDIGHSRFLSPEMAEQHRDVLAGELEGIGAYVEMRDGRVVIVAPLDNSPAQEAGLRPGDIILRVNGDDTTSLSTSEVVQRIQGPSGTEVSLTIMDPESESTRKVVVERAEVELDNVTWAMLPGTSVAQVRIATFSEGVGEDLRPALQEVANDGAEGLILDLRNSPGGLLNEAVAVASQFMKDGDVLQRIDAEGEVSTVPVEAGGQATEIPIVVLANGGTASAAEIVVGALQDNDRATVVGQTTAGAGTVLNEFPLSDASVLLLAVEEWRTPDGRTIWHQGLEPDVMVALPPGGSPIIPRELRQTTTAPLQESQDTQLLRGLELVRSDSDGSES